MVGSVMAAEAVKLVTGSGDPLVGRLVVLDALAMTWRTLPVARDPLAVPVTSLTPEPAPAGRDADEVPSVSASELAGLLARDEVLLVDVREPDEREIVTITGSLHVPMARFRSGEAAAELPAGRPVVLHCKVGARSAEALGLLRAAGWQDVRHLDGGVLAWVREVDPTLPAY
jgi:adenylyltransferase/sulfurtransferase